MCVLIFITCVPIISIAKLLLTKSKYHCTIDKTISIYSIISDYVIVVWSKYKEEMSQVSSYTAKNNCRSKILEILRPLQHYKLFSPQCATSR